MSAADMNGRPANWSSACASFYWARLSGFSGDLDNVLANNNVDPGAKFTITVKPTDKGLEIGSDCGAMTKA